jgi:hypothetical protein
MRTTTLRFVLALLLVGSLTACDAVDTDSDPQTIDCAPGDDECKAEQQDTGIPCDPETEQCDTGIPCDPETEQCDTGIPCDPETEQCDTGEGGGQDTGEGGQDTGEGGQDTGAGQGN